MSSDDKTRLQVLTKFVESETNYLTVLQNVSKVKLEISKKKKLQPTFCEMKAILGTLRFKFADFGV